MQLSENISSVGDCSLRIIGNVAQVYIDLIKLKKVNIGYNLLFTIPKPYKAIGIVDGYFKDSYNNLESYVRLQGNELSIYSPKEYSDGRKYNYFSTVFLVEKIN